MAGVGEIPRRWWRLVRLWSQIEIGNQMGFMLKAARNQLGGVFWKEEGRSILEFSRLSVKFWD
jgi:hypothetical protein